ncbi:phage minor head protein [Streptomyces hokutonensis]|uniref:phage minor head protein n=1 Tax=Streptomyces hokutonensis TaxID=1306990 RepID=UPI003688E3E7
MADTPEQGLAAAEVSIAEEVRAVLDDVANQIAGELADATEIVAARFSLTRIGRMWTARMPRILRRLLGAAETAAQQAADDVHAELPDGWDDLPGRQERGDELPASLGSYVTDTEHLLRAVGDRLTQAAVAELAAGLDNGEDIAQLRARLRALFSQDGEQLGEMREERIARTEATRAWNAATLAAAEDLTTEDRPLVKQWQTRRDARVRDAHDAVDGQLRLLDEAFTVAGVAMHYPGDPTAPPQLTVNCRCILRLAPEQRAAAAEIQDRFRDTFSDRRHGGASLLDQLTATLRSELARAGIDSPEQYSVAWDSRPLNVTAAAAAHTGAMIALLLSDDDAQRLALEDGEPAGELHCTLMFLGKGDDWNTEQRAALVAAMRDYAPNAPIAARAFGIAHWNPHGDDPVWVWNLGDNREDRHPGGPDLQDARVAAVYAVEDAHEASTLPEIPAQHSPWQPHVTAVYDASPERFHDLVEHVGPVTFDRIRVAFAGEHFDIPLGPAEEEPPMATPTQAEAEPPPPQVRTWSTPDGAALAFENQQTGDGRIFTRGALYWDGAGPWPLQYAEAMGQGHDGAELAGSIHTLGRRGDDITGSGSLYLTQPAGSDAVLLLEQEAPLGVSVDLDDVDVQLVDTTATLDDEADVPMLAASFASASVMRLDDGTWMISGRERGEWTASGIEMAHSARTTMLFTSSGGTITAATARRVFGDQLTAAAGEADPNGGVIFHEEKSGDYLVRITRARLRGATLVSMPAYDKARIVLDPPDEQTASAPVLVASSSDGHERVVTYVRTSPTPVGPRHLSDKLGMSLDQVHAHLNRALEAGSVVRIARGLYVGASTLPEGPITAAAPDDTEPGPLSADEATAAAALDALYEERGADIVASAWQVLQTEDPMPAAWFREPTPEELPPGSGGVHIDGGRAYGWVAQRGVPHATHGRKVTIEKLAQRGLDLSHFLRSKFRLDDGSEVRAGAMTMNVGHHRDGYECETSVCQFDDTRTVAAVVTVGMNEGGLWFSGAAAPWLSPWDRTVFQACQPSYHMTRGGDGRWQLKAVLSVPVPGHSSPLTAAAVVDRSNLALTAAAAVIDETTVTASEPLASEPEPEPEHARARDEAPAANVGEITAALLEPAFLDQFADALKTREEQRAAAARAELAELTARLAPLRAELAASAAPQPERN